MKILLDTCAFLWAAQEPERLSKQAWNVVCSPDSELLFSAVSVWELALKTSIGKLELDVSLAMFVANAIRDLKLTTFPLEFEATLLAAGLPLRHKDPFDRMLVCQAMYHNLPILTPDSRIGQYGVSCVW